MADNVELAKEGLGGVQKTAETLYALIAEHSEAVAANEEIIDISSVRQIEEASRGLHTLYEVVRDILAAVDARRSAAAKMHRETQALIHSRLELTREKGPAAAAAAAKDPAGGPWNGRVVIRSCEQGPSNVAPPGQFPPGPFPPGQFPPGQFPPGQFPPGQFPLGPFPGALPPPRPVARIAVAPGIQLEACVIPAAAGGTPPGVAAAVFAQVQTPQLHYYPPWGHFLIRVGSVVLHGGVGEVFDDRRKSKRARRQVRTTPCRNAGCAGGKACPFYHDPAQFHHSQEVRNYSQLSWLYAPDPEQGDSRAARRLGSGSQITTDIKAMRPGDAVLIADQAMMSLLLALVACKYCVAPK